MGIFFDQDWFDDRLKAAGLTRAAMAQAAGMTIDEVEMVFSDRRELEGPEVRAIARMLSADPSEVAMRSGAADADELAAAPVMRSPRRETGAQPGFVVTREVIAGLHERLDRLERLVELVIQKLDRR
jgi:Helix-turn-helix domain